MQLRWKELTGNVVVFDSHTLVSTVTYPLKTDTSRQSNVNAGVNVGVKLTDTQRKTLEIIKHKPEITHPEIAEALSLTVKTVERTTKFLRELGLLKRYGSNKKGYWTTCDKNK